MKLKQLLEQLNKLAEKKPEALEMEVKTDIKHLLDLPKIGDVLYHKKYVGMKVKIIALTENRVVYEIIECLGNTKGKVNSYDKSEVWNKLTNKQ